MGVHAAITFACRNTRYACARVDDGDCAPENSLDDGENHQSQSRGRWVWVLRVLGVGQFAGAKSRQYARNETIAVVAGDSVIGAGRGVDVGGGWLAVVPRVAAASRHPTRAVRRRPIHGASRAGTVDA